MFRRASTTLFLVLVLVAIAVSAYFFGKRKSVNTIRSTFTFVSTSETLPAHSPLNIESRYLPKKRGNIAIRTYIEDLLLGPITEHCEPIFDPSTKCLLCTKMSGTLKVDLSKEAWLLAERAESAALAALKDAQTTQGTLSKDKPVPTEANQNDKSNSPATIDPQAVADKAKKASILSSVELFSTNIKNNFHAVKSVVVTIEGVDPITGRD